MAIPEARLEAWSLQGSVTQVKDTYATIKAALEDPAAHYADRDFKVFLQGSYGNDTNVHAERDVNVVIHHFGSFLHDLTDLPAEQQAEYGVQNSTAKYSYPDFRSHVHKVLKAAFGSSVNAGNKTIKIKAEGPGRSADVLVALKYRRYHKFNSQFDKSYDEGIAFPTSGVAIATNYPKQHFENCAAKDQATNGKFKPLVRIFKNMRDELLKENEINEGVAPAYFIEGLLYNLPNETFSGSYKDTVFNTLIWINETTDRSKFVFANQQGYLFGDSSIPSWPRDDAQYFINAVSRMWNVWGQASSAASSDDG
jgi:hypothetical protein